MKKLSRLCEAEQSTVILFVDRYLTSFDKYVEQLRVRRVGKTIIARTPLFNRIELKLFARKLPDGHSVAVYIPLCTSEAVMRAQRKFLFRDVPEIEFDAADKMALPTIQDGYSEITVAQVKQGD